MTLPPSGNEPSHEFSLSPGVSYTAQIISEIDRAAIPREIRDLVCCALCGRPTPWKDCGLHSFDNDWVLLREPSSIELFSVPVAGAEFYRRIATLIYRDDLIGIWCPSCAASRTVRSTAQTEVF
jgi:hypothetical protein